MGKVTNKRCLRCGWIFAESHIVCPACGRDKWVHTSSKSAKSEILFWKKKCFTLLSMAVKDAEKIKSLKSTYDYLKKIHDDKIVSENEDAAEIQSLHETIKLLEVKNRNLQSNYASLSSDIAMQKHKLDKDIKMYDSKYNELLTLHLELMDKYKVESQKAKEAQEDLISRALTLNNDIRLRDEKIERLSSLIRSRDSVISTFISLPWYKRIFWK